VTPPTAPTSSQQGSARLPERFFGGVVWSWLGVAVSILSGLILSPYIIHKVGDEAYGVWSLVFALVDYYWLMDLGFRSATFKYTAHYRALGQPGRVNEVLNTGLLYSCFVAAVTMAASIYASAYADRFFRISPAFRPVFSLLILMVGLSWSAGSMFTLITACVESFQRFDMTSSIWIATITVRTVGCFVVLALGHGLIWMGSVVLASQFLGYALNFWTLRRIAPEIRFSPRLARLTTFRQMFRYGVHTFVATIASQSLEQTAPVFIGHFLPTAFVGYYSLPRKLLHYSADLVARTGIVTTAHAAEMAAHQDYEGIGRLAVYVNRYSLALFAPIAVGASIYGYEIMRVLTRQQFAVYAGPLLPVLAVGMALGVAAQFNSGSVLYGLGKHQGWAYPLLGEAVVRMIAMWLLIPRYGIMGAAVINTATALANRGLLVSWMLCRSLKIGFSKYLFDVYAAPLGIAVPSFLITAWVKQHWLPGHNLPQVLAGLFITAVVYYALAYYFCLSRKHRSVPLQFIRKKFYMKAA
jgi:O-antigen/teichoic acid export membrane protein